MKKRLLLVFISLLLLSAISLAESHIYDDAQVKNVMNGFRNKKIGEYSIIYAMSKDVTLDALNDWYFNYVAVNDFNWNLIIYEDSDSAFGVYAIHGIVQKNLCFELDKYGEYSVGDTTDDTEWYYPADGTLKLLGE